MSNDGLELKPEGSIVIGLEDNGNAIKLTEFQASAVEEVTETPKLRSRLRLIAVLGGLYVSSQGLHVQHCAITFSTDEHPLTDNPCKALNVHHSTGPDHRCNRSSHHHLRAAHCFRLCLDRRSLSVG